MRLKMVPVIDRDHFLAEEDAKPDHFSGILKIVEFTEEKPLTGHYVNQLCRIMPSSRRIRLWKFVWKLWKPWKQPIFQKMLCKMQEKSASFLFVGSAKNNYGMNWKQGAG